MIKKNPDISDFTQCNSTFTVYITLNWKERVKPITGIGNKLNLAYRKKEKNGKGEKKRR